MGSLAWARRGATLAVLSAALGACGASRVERQVPPPVICPYSALAKQRRLVVQITSAATSAPKSGTLTLDDCPARTLEPAVLEALANGKAEVALDVAHSLPHRVRLTLDFGSGSVSAEATAEYFDPAISFRLHMDGRPTLAWDVPARADEACLSRPKGAEVPFRVRFRDTMSRNYVLKQLHLHLGDLVLTKDPLELAATARDGAPVNFDVTMPAGCHPLHVGLVYRGAGVGAYSYLNGYRFEITAPAVVEVQSGGVFEVVAYEQETLVYAERPAVAFRVHRPEPSPLP